jgi:hypothetical protein
MAARIVQNVERRPALLGSAGVRAEDPAAGDAVVGATGRETSMDIAPGEAIEIAAECARSIDWQTKTLFDGNGNVVDTEDAVAAITPKRPSTLRLIEGMKARQEQNPLASIVGPWVAVRVTLLAPTCESIAAILAEQGYHREAGRICDALQRHRAAIQY